MSRRTDTGILTRKKSNNASFPPFEQPQPIGFFSVNSQRMYQATAEELKYYRAPALCEYPLDLNAGIHKAIKKPESQKDERLDHLLSFIFDHRNEVMEPNAPFKKLLAEFACWRGLLRIIMCTPYENKEDWCLHVTRYRGTCYMVQKETIFKKRQRLNQTRAQTAMFAWGFKFEQYCLSKNPGEKPNTNEPVDECAEFYTVFHVKLQNMLLLYGAEMDGILSDQAVSLKDDPSVIGSLKFVELKVRQGINEHERQKHSYQTYKTRNWWCQSFLTGVKDIFVGLRDEHGLVHKVEPVLVRDLARESKAYWSATICANFLVEFLMYVRKLMENVDCPYTVYDFYFHARTGTINYCVVDGKTENSFLPDWYLAIFEDK